MKKNAKREGVGSKSDTVVGNKTMPVRAGKGLNFANIYSTLLFVGAFHVISFYLHNNRIKGGLIMEILIKLK